jgi:hypothetical protein
MLRHRTTAFVCVCLAGVSAACNEGPKPATPGSGAQALERADARVRVLADAYLDGFFKRNPDQVTLFGVSDGAIPVSFLHQKVRAWAAK